MLKKEFVVPMLVICCIVFLSIAKESPDVFIGPFTNWLNVKRDFGAKGDGKTDDTKALQIGLDSLGKNTYGRTLYLPAGTYRITRTLHLEHQRHVAIFGEDPATTKIVWDGAADSTMMRLSSVAYSRFGRISFDGKGKAGKGMWHDWIGGNYFPTSLEDFDLRFQDLKIGIQGGEYPSSIGNQSTTAEMTVVRCQFRRCTEGIMLNDFNTVDWWIRHCLFEDNVMGVSVRIGVASVYDCIFKRSSSADIYQAHNEYSAIRNNYSIGSRRFYEQGGPSNWAYALTFQGNVVLDPDCAIPILFPCPGPVLFMDNIVRSAAHQADVVVQFGSFLRGNFVSVGNTFTLATPYGIDLKNNRFKSINDTIVDRKTIQITEPVLPSTPRQFDGTIIEVKSFTGEAIQTAINEALKYSGKKPVVHLKAGGYSIQNSLRIPASDIQLVGEKGYCPSGDDGEATRLIWEGKSGGTVLFLDGPSKVSLKDFYVFCNGKNGKAHAVVVTDADQIGSRVFHDQFAVVNDGTVDGYGIYAHGLDNTFIQGWNCGVNSSTNTSIMAEGGERLAKGDTTAMARVCNFGGATAGCPIDKTMYDVRNNGKLLIEDTWFETGIRGLFMNLTNASSGTITLQGGKNQFTGKGGYTVTHSFNGFNGKFCMTGYSILGTNMQITGDNPKQNVLFMANAFSNQDGFPARVALSAKQGNAAVAFTTTDTVKGANIDWYPDKGSMNDAWMLDMLSQARTNKPDRDISDLPAGVTDVRIWRVGICGCRNGLEVRGKN